MATLVLGAVGTLVGGPLGGAIGATLGRSLDTAIIGTPRREGPRLKELAISTSSYGQPIPALYGTVRVPGTIVWATDLTERRDSSSGGKGSPGTTAYSYSVSLAVALSSRPIDRVGRIWADGNLLRGKEGDLKTRGKLRIHRGHADQLPDPLMAAGIGAQCPAHRGCAYVVFEDLALEDFGNRIPAISFEVFAGSAADIVSELAGQVDIDSSRADFPELDGFIHEGGSLAALLAQFDRLRPLDAVTRDGRAAIKGGEQPVGEVPVLPPPAAWDEGDFGRDNGTDLARRSPVGETLSALRYYDPSRDYQPSLQRADGMEPGIAGQTLEFPGVFEAAAARGLLERASHRARQRGETLSWRIVELDPALGPGRIVRAPGHPGLWRIEGREWRERGIELELVRHVAPAMASSAADSGLAWSAPDRLAVETLLRVFELPWDGVASPGTPQVYAAVGAPTGRWSGASLYRESGGTLIPTGSSGPVRAVGGKLAGPLGASPGLRFEAAAMLRVELDDHDAGFAPVGLDAIAGGANRLLVGGEIVQFAQCQAEGSGIWLLTGLLRGRGGTEIEALAGHAAGARVTLLDNRLRALSADIDPGGKDRFAAIGLADSDPVFAAIENVGRTRRPLLPVQPRGETDPEGNLLLRWTRRARGGWAWLDEVEQPLVEQAEIYEVGLGDSERPDRVWTTLEPRLRLDASEVGSLAVLHPGKPIWVRQKGSFAVSPPLRLTTLPSS
ncbi:phage tail protein [Qipengyuania qiaonensis]|uniref:Phage tail protein n=1 Tax=Qipengyuania qiaonensis TaxID=2867240 RepID=A0ABS7J2A5_9SPHN|nr:phage tail protein [Qipengyuania qiaonensis]MBX7481463.1 phage tail protein [Qipengyuania qiaonensis]